MPDVAVLRDFAIRCRQLAETEHDRRLRNKFLTMAEDYERRADQTQSVQPH